MAGRTASGGGRTGRRRRKKRKLAAYVPVVMIVMLLAVTISVSLFFRVTEIHVEGSTRYSSEDITALSGIEIGDNVFFISESKAAINICDNLHYVEAVKIVRTLPTVVTISVTESSPVAYVFSGGAFWLLDENSRLLDRTDASGSAGKIEIRGLSLDNPTAGKPAAAPAEDAVKLDYLSRLLKAMADKGMCENVAYIDISAVSRIEFDYVDRLTVKFGRGDYAEHKLELLLKVLESLNEEDVGSILFTSESEAHFVPN